MKTVALAEICEFASGGTPNRADESFYTGDIPWITGADIVGDRIKPRSYITDSAIAGSAAKIVPSGTVLLVTRTSVGKVAIADRDMSFSQDITALVPNEGKLQRRFLVHLLRSKLAYFSRHARGATIKGVTRSVVMDLKIPDLPFSDQCRIADILDKADALRTKRREAIAHLDALGPAIFHEMFAGSQDWPVSNLELLAMPEKGSVRTGPFGSQLLTSEFTSNGVAVLGIDNTVGNSFSWKGRRFISEEKYEQLKRYTVHPGDLIITIMGTLGRCAVVPEDIPRSINTKHLCCITLDRQQVAPVYVHAYFLYHRIAARYLRQTTKGSIMAGLNMGIIKAMPVLVPPVELQQEFVDRIAVVERLKSKHQAQLAELDNLFLSLQDRAFKGEL